MGSQLALNQRSDHLASPHKDSLGASSSPQARCRVLSLHRLPSAKFQASLPLSSAFISNTLCFFPFHFRLYFPILQQCREEVKVVHLELEKKVSQNSKLTIPNSKQLGESKCRRNLKTWLQTINQKHLSQHQSTLGFHTRLAKN